MTATLASRAQGEETTGIPTHRRAPRRDLAAVVLAVTLVTAIELTRLVVLARHHGIAGVDHGNWLTLGHKLLGQGLPGGSRTVYPPIVPWASVGFVTAWGPLWGTWILAVAAGAAPAAGVYIVLRRHGLRNAAAILAGVTAAARFTGEAVAWGGIPQLLGLGLVVVTLDQIADVLRRPSVRGGWTLGVLILATAAVSHLMLAQLAACGLVLTVLHLLVVRSGLTFTGPWRGALGWPRMTLRLITPSLLLAPLYVRLTGSVAASFTATSHGAPLRMLLEDVSGLYWDAPSLWKTATVLAVLTPAVRWRERRDPLWLLATSILVSVVAAVLITGQDRLLYLLPLGVIFALALWVRALSGSRLKQRTAARWGLALVAVLLAGFAIVGGLQQFSAQVDFYGQRLLPRDTVVALNWLRDHTPASSVVAVPSVEGAPVGWWVEGYARRVSLTGSLDQWLAFPDERKRSHESVALYSLTSDDTQQLLGYARGLGVDYLYVPTTWAGLPSSTVGRLVLDEPTRVVFRNSAALIVRVSS